MENICLNIIDQATDIDEISKAPTYVPEILKPISNDNVITHIPKSMQKPINNLLDQIKGNTNITWDDKGVVSINGKVIVGSNITDIMNDAARERTSRTHAVGWLDVAEELINKNQKISVGNKRWSNHVNKRASDIVNISSSKKHSKKKHLRQSIDNTDDYVTPVKRSIDTKWSNW